MQWLRENIFVRIIVPFLAEIFLSYSVRVNVAWWVVIVTVCASPLLVMPLLRAGTRYSLNFTYGISLAFLCVAGGYMLKYVSTDMNHQSYFGNYRSGTNYFIGRVDDEPSASDKTDKIHIEVLAAKETGKWKNVSGEALIYIKKDSLAGAIKYGDILLFRNNFSPVKKDRNPYAIDYKFILNNRNIFETGFIGNGGWAVVEHTQGFNLYKEALAIRNACITIMNRYIPDHESATVAASLLLGYRGDMSNELQNAYIKAGVIHILAVSGMQVGLLFLLLNFSLRWMERNRFLKWMKVLLLIIAIVFFTLITGLSGSVVRAAAMLSVIVLGRQMERHVSATNILFASAFILIVIQPAITFDVGFELSFFAVWGILMFHKPIRSLLSTHNKFLDYCLNTTAVSLAAQAGTLPLILYYFHQFPIHFLFVNLVVIPFSSIILYGLIFLLGFNLIPPLAHLLGIILQYLVIAMDAFVRWVQQWPLALWYINHFDVSFLIVFFIVMILIYLFLTERRLLYLNYALGLMVLLVIISGIYNYYEGARKRIVVFEYSKGIVFTCTDGSDAVLFYSSHINMEGTWFEKYLAQYYRAEGVKKVVTFNTDKVYQYSVGDISINGDIITLPGFSIKCIKNSIILYSKNSELTIFPERFNASHSLTAINPYIVSDKGPLIIDL